jgi:hypothetical protein
MGYAWCGAVPGDEDNRPRLTLRQAVSWSVIGLLSESSADSCRRWSEFRACSGGDGRSPCDRGPHPSLNRPDLFFTPNLATWQSPMRDASTAGIQQAMIEGHGTTCRSRGIGTSWRIAVSSRDGCARRGHRRVRAKSRITDLASPLALVSPVIRSPPPCRLAWRRGSCAPVIYHDGGLPSTGNVSVDARPSTVGARRAPDSSAVGTGVGFQDGGYGPPVRLPSRSDARASLSNPNQVERLERWDS